MTDETSAYDSIKFIVDHGCMGVKCSNCPLFHTKQHKARSALCKAIQAFV